MKFFFSFTYVDSLYVRKMQNASFIFTENGVFSMAKWVLLGIADEVCSKWLLGL